MTGIVTSLTDNDLVSGNFGGQDGHVPVKLLLRHTAIVTISGTAYDARLSDEGKLFETTNGSAVTITILRESTIPWPSLSILTWEQNGAGQITFAAGSGVTIHSPETLKSAKQYATGSLIYKGSDVWLLGGNIEASA